MNIPSSVKVGGHRIHVKKVSPSEINGPGEYSNFYRLIRLEDDPDIPESAQAEVFMHELLECVKVLNNLQLDHTVLTVLSEGLFSIIRNNNLDFR